MKKIILSIAIAAVAICNNSSAQAQIIRTFAGNDSLGHTGDSGPAYMAQMGTSWGMNMDRAGNIYVADDYLNQIRKISTNGVITTIAGVGYPGYSGDGGAATSAHLNYPSGIALDKYGNLYFADNGNFAIRKIDTAGIITTVAGDGTGRHGSSGDGGLAIHARMMGCVGVALDKIGNLYFTDGNTSIRKVDTSGIITTVAGSSAWGFYGNGISATSAVLAGPCSIVVDTAGNIFFSDQLNLRIRKIDASGTITTIAGTGATGFSGEGGAATSAKLNSPSGLALDNAGNVYFADGANNRIRKIDASGIITTVVGTGRFNYTGDGGPATAATMRYPAELCIGANGNMYIYDRRNYAIREVVMQNGIPAVASAGNNICEGTPDTFTANPGAYTYGLSGEWTVNGTVVGTGLTFSSSSLLNGDVVAYRMVDPLHHFTLDSSAAIVMTVNPLVTPAVSISSSTGDTICGETRVTYTATSVNGGSAPFYQWQVNGINTDTGATYNYYPSSGNIITNVLTSNVACPTARTVTSRGIRMDVNPVVTPAVTVSATSTALCQGTVATFSATPVNGGSTPHFQWKKFGATVGTGSTYTYTPASGDIISCELTSNAACRTTDTASDDVTLTVNPIVDPIVNIVSVPATRIDYAGELVTFYSEVTFGGSAPTYQWFLNNNLVPGATNSSYATNVYSTDTVICQVVSNGHCANTTPTSSNLLVILGNNSTAVNDIHNSTTGFNLYPNPNNGIFTLSGTLPATENEEVTLSVYDIIGKLIYTTKTTAQNGKINQQLNIENMPTGRYMLHLDAKNTEKTIQFTITK